MNTNIKVAGTTFHPLPENDYLTVKSTYEVEGVPCADTDAVLMPEPGNRHDPYAVQVFVRLDNGTAFCIGYLPKDEPLKMTISAAKRPVTATVMVKNYAAKNQQYSASWIITEVSGL